ncbi:class I SAM-dependent methyltransferase [Neptunicoccus cionae]|uniref:class I SAM-dependent methyltransferase n=1 Tax=Neptunicoccus cionae TaxID=2035344 RepID=UPI00257004C1|nr:class I SAM-dependent methyltransferase [Amylibacter cionae]
MTDNRETEVLAGYARDAEDLIDRFEALDPLQVFAPVLDFLPVRPCRVLDVAAGTGRDAAWLARAGHIVTAVEPVAAFRSAGQSLHRGLDLTWSADQLPDLTELRQAGGLYDVLILNGVWHHLKLAERETALRTLCSLAAPVARLVISVRNGPAPAGRPSYGGEAGRLLGQARDIGLSVTCHKKVASVQPQNIAAGVTWDWLVLEVSGAEGRKGQLGN